MKIAVVGCAHGELQKIYESLAYLENENQFKVDVLLCCGDFQATRNVDDLECMAVPPKYRDMCTFYKYYSGDEIAPVLTIVIGGNHEASNYMQELAYGGWLAPNIYYLGYAGVVKVANLRIGGLSGIFKGRDYYKGHFEKPPYSGDTVRSCYHIRALDVFRLKQVSKHVDIMLSHDWPQGIHHHGDVRHLLKRKPFFKDDIDSNSLGSKPSAELLEVIKPSFWFSAHLHVKFPAVIRNAEGSSTKFLALDKCLPRRPFLQVVDVPHEGKIELSYDIEWLTILQLTNHLVSVRSSNVYLPGPGSDERWKFTPTIEEIKAVNFKMGENLIIPQNFEATVAAYNPSSNVSPRMPSAQLNPQTTAFCHLLGIDDPLALLLQHLQVTPRHLTGTPNSSVNGYSSFEISRDEESLCTPLKLLAPRTPLHLPSPTSTSSPLTSEEIPSRIDEPPVDRLQMTPRPFSATSNSSSLGYSSLDVSGDAEKSLHTPMKYPNQPALDSIVEPSFEITVDPSPHHNDQCASKRAFQPRPTHHANSSFEGCSSAPKFKRRNMAIYTNSEVD